MGDTLAGHDFKEAIWTETIHHYHCGTDKQGRQ